MLLTNSIQALVRQLNSLLIGAFQAMGKIPWSSLQTVGDQSEYVTQIASIVSTGMITIRKSVTNPKHLRWFCDKFVE